MSSASVAQLSRMTGAAQAVLLGKWTLTGKSVPRTSAGVVNSAMEGDVVFLIKPSELLKDNGVLPVPSRGPEGAFFLLRCLL